MGSPPHTRGEFAGDYFCQFCSGITPAYAGRIVIIGLIGFMSRDHPRIRGENLARHEACAPIVGSPPHTRGEYVCAIGVNDHFGISPAYAGRI